MRRNKNKAIPKAFFNTEYRREDAEFRRAKIIMFYCFAVLCAFLCGTLRLNNY